MRSLVSIVCTLALAASAASAAPLRRGLPAADRAESIPLQLIRTIQTGTPQGLSVAEMLDYAHGNEASYAGHVLARSALVVLGEDRGFPEWPLPRLLDRSLSQLQQTSHHLGAEMPARFNAEHLIATVVYALVMSGQTEPAIDVLERHLETGSDYKRDVLLQALRHIGTDRANGLIQQTGERSYAGNMPDNLLADQHYPFLHELASRAGRLAPGERTRAKLYTLAAQGCGEESAMAVYFLGFQPEDRGATRELALLRSLARAACFHTRFFARRALALRSAESIEFWLDLYRDEHDAWQRAQLVRIAFARFGADFLPASLRLLADEPVQYVQWELMHANLQLRRGDAWRQYWDLWLTPTLQFRLNHPAREEPMAAGDVDELLRWLESGAHPRNEVVDNHLYYGLAREVDGASTRRLLRSFAGLADYTARWWILQPLADPQALPLLRYWQTLESAQDQRRMLENTIVRLQTLAESDTRSASAAGHCCAATRACLLGHVSVGRGRGPAEISTAAQARAWLEADLLPVAEPQIEFTDTLRRAARVRRPDGEAEQWRHLYGCWRRIESAGAIGAQH